MGGLTVREASKELGISARTVFRMMKDGRLKAEKVDMPYGKFIWKVDMMSIARIQVRKEMGIETPRRRKHV
jgi:excisionase family DNA binding protein